MKATAIVPIKRFAAAKQRLAAAMSDARRGLLAAAMTADVLAAISLTPSIARTIVVSDEPLALANTDAPDVQLTPEPPNGGHVGAVLAGIARAEADGARCVVVVSGDCPLLDPNELNHLLADTRAPRVAIVPDRHGRGTNALVLSPPGAIVPAFGEESRARHAEAARRAGIPCTIAPLPSLGLDLDTPSDLAAFTAAVEAAPGRASRTARALRRRT